MIPNDLCKRLASSSTWVAIVLSLPLLAVGAGAQKIVLRTASQEATPARYNPGDKEMPGLCIEILHAIEQVDPGLSFTGLDDEAPLQRALAEVRTDRLDLFSCAAYTPERATQLTYLHPQIYSTRVVLAVRSSDKVDVRSLSEIAKLGADNFVIVPRGTILEDMAEKVAGLNVDAGSSDKLANLRKLLSGRARYYCETELNLTRAIYDAHAENEVRILPTALTDEPQYIVVSKHLAPAIIARLSADLKVLDAAGALQRIYGRYAIAPDH